MSSRSFINLCATLTLCRFTAEVILKDCPESDAGNRKIRRISTKIINTVTEARLLWPEASPADVHQVMLRVETLGSSILHGKREFIELVALALGLLSDMEPSLKGKRKEAISTLADLMLSINRTFDGRLERNDAYEYAGNKAEEWYATLGL